MLRRSPKFALLVLTALLGTVAPSFADDDERGDENHRHDRIRGAVERGEIKPLVDVLQFVQPKLPGEIVGVEAEYTDGRWVYEFRVLDRQGRMFEVSVDAATAEISRIEDK
ncbi:MAG: peptidase [Hyphomicrobiaceae bacterium]